MNPDSAKIKATLHLTSTTPEPSFKIKSTDPYRGLGRRIAKDLVKASFRSLTRGFNS